MPSTRAKRTLDTSTSSSRPSDQECAACLAAGREETESKDDSWVCCEECEAWSHWDCVRSSPDDAVDSLEKWYCEECIAGSQEWETPLEIVYKDSPRKSARTTSKLNYASLEMGIENDPERFIRQAESKPIQPNNFKRMRGKDLTLEWVMSDPQALLEPIIIESPEGLDMRMPRSTMTVMDVANAVGADRPVEVMDVASQNGLDNWTLGRWAQYFHDPNRSKIRNVISLEVSDTKLSAKVIPPKIVRQIDWIETIWPRKLKDQGVYPKVQKYCLMSVAKCWTDWHVDFAASSVYYHILSGGKTFFFIRPTPENLRKYELWSGSHLKQEQEYLGDSVDAVYRVDLKPGNTMIIPSGWIHSVYTPSDALVFGGNFLHSLNIGTQLRIFEIEKKTKVPMKYRFPYFVTFLWYVARYYHGRLAVALGEQTRVYEKERIAQQAEKAAKQAEAAAAGQAMPLDFSDEKDFKAVEKVKLAEIDGELTLRVLHGLKKLTLFILEQGERFLPDSTASADAKRWAVDNKPAEIEDAYGFAVIFRAQVLNALGDREDLPNLLQKPALAVKKPTVPQKRKAPSAAPGAPKFKNFAPEPSKVQKLESGGTITEQTERGEPTTVTTQERRSRPAPNSFEEGDGEAEDAQVRMTSTETIVTRITRHADGRVMREVRTSRTTVERTSWQPRPKPANGTVAMGQWSPVPLNGYHSAGPPASRPAPQPAPRPQPVQQRPPSNPMQYQTASKPAAQHGYLQFDAPAQRMPQYSLPAPKAPMQEKPPASPYSAHTGISNPAMYSSAIAYGRQPVYNGAQPATNGQQDPWSAFLSQQAMAAAQMAYYAPPPLTSQPAQYGIPANRNGASST